MRVERALTIVTAFLVNAPMAFWLVGNHSLLLARKIPGSNPIPVLLAQDKGKFRILLDGQRVGTEEFQIEPKGSHWVARAKVEVTPPGGSAEQDNAVLDLNPDGTPTHYEWSSEGKDRRSLAVDFQGVVAKLALRKAGGQPFVEQFSFPTARVIVLDNNMYHQYDILARLYDWNAKGSQTFSVLIPQDQLPGTITVESLGQKSAEGAKLDCLRVRSADLEVNLYLDNAHRLIRLEVPAAKAEVIRE